MNTLHLKYAVEVERTRSITQAADNLYMAQPNLSKAIRELEDTLGITIFERTSKGVLPTKKGAEFLGYAKKILAQLDKMEALRDIGDADLRSFDLAVPYGGYIMDAFARFCNSLSTSEVRLSYREADMAEVISRVTEERSDIGLIRCRSANLNQVEHYLMQKELAFEPVWEYACVLLMARSHPLASFGAITEDSLAECVELCRETGGVWNADKTLQREKTGVRLYGCADTEALLCRIEKAYMFVPPALASIYEGTPLIQKTYSDAVRYTDLLIYPKEGKLTELSLQFIDTLYAAKNAVVFLY